MRNSKVRRRIAAGKLRLRIRDLRNLGPRSEDMLARVGIRSVEALRQRGGLGAYLALRRAGETQTLNALWALVGALDPWPEGTDWREVSAGDRRLTLLLAVEQADAAAAAPRRRRTGSGAAGGRARAGDVRLRAAPQRLQDEAWAPGLPFPAETKTPRAKAGRRSKKQGEVA